MNLRFNQNTSYNNNYFHQNELFWIYHNSTMKDDIFSISIHSSVNHHPTIIKEVNYHSLIKNNFIKDTGWQLVTGEIGISDN